MKGDTMDNREAMKRMRDASIKASDLMNEARRMVIGLRSDLKSEIERADANEKATHALASMHARIRRLHTMYVEDMGAAEEGTAVWKERSAMVENIASLMSPEVPSNVH